MSSLTDIYNSIKNNDFDSFKNLVSTITNFETINFDIDYDISYKFIRKTNIPILHLLAGLNLIEFFQYLHQEKHIPLKQIDEQNLLPLHYACFAGSTEVALYILKEDPEESRYTPDGTKQHPLLYLGALGGKLEIVKGLLAAGAKITDPWINEFELVLISRNCPDIFSYLLSQCSPKVYEGPQGTLVLWCINDGSNIQSIEAAYRGIEDLKSYFIRGHNYCSLFERAMMSTKISYIKDFVLRIIDDAIKFDISIEPPQSNDPKIIYDGACHWMCSCLDLDVAKKVIKTKDFDINRFGPCHLLGATRLIEKRNKNDVILMLRFLIENGFDVNKRYDLDSPTLLESFVGAISKNYAAIEFLIKNGADINALCSKHTDRNGNRMKLVDFVKERSDRKMKAIFDNAD